MRVQISLRTRFALGLVTVLLPFLLAAAVGQFYLLPRLIGPLDDIVREFTEKLEPVTHLQKALPLGERLLRLPDPVGNAAAARDMERFDAHIDQAVSALDIGVASWPAVGDAQALIAAADAAMYAAKQAGRNRVICHAPMPVQPPTPGWV